MIGSNPPIQQIIEAGLLQPFTEFLESSNEKLQFESSWIITNIASGTSEQTRALVTYGVPTKLAKLLSHPNEDIREQAIWGLGRAFYSP